MGKPYQHAHCDASVSSASSAAAAASAATTVTVPSDLLFQPIAEDEPGFDEETLEAIIGSGDGTGGGEAAAAAVDTTKVSTTFTVYLGLHTCCFFHRCHARLLEQVEIRLHWQLAGAMPGGGQHGKTPKSESTEPDALREFCAKFNCTW